jgi:hypothetical protein
MFRSGYPLRVAVVLEFDMTTQIDDTHRTVVANCCKWLTLSDTGQRNIACAEGLKELLKRSWRSSGVRQTG